MPQPRVADSAPGPFTKCVKIRIKIREGEQTSLSQELGHMRNEVGDERGCEPGEAVIHAPAGRQREAEGRQSEAAKMAASPSATVESGTTALNRSFPSFVAAHATPRPPVILKPLLSFFVFTLSKNSLQTFFSMCSY